VIRTGSSFMAERWCSRRAISSYHWITRGPQLRRTQCGVCLASAPLYCIVLLFLVSILASHIPSFCRAKLFPSVLRNSKYGEELGSVRSTAKIATNQKIQIEGFVFRSTRDEIKILQMYLVRYGEFPFNRHGWRADMYKNRNHL
jgi:hypothetical protein